MRKRGKFAGSVVKNGVFFRGIGVFPAQFKKVDPTPDFIDNRRGYIYTSLVDFYLLI